MGKTTTFPINSVVTDWLELLYDVGTHQGLEEARNLFEGLSNPRKEILGRLLACCTSVKAVRLFLTWAR